MTFVQFAIAREYAVLKKAEKRRELTQDEEERFLVLAQAVERYREIELDDEGLGRAGLGPRMG